MSDKELRVAPHFRRLPAHPSITPGQISDLVERFYGRVRDDHRLGPPSRRASRAHGGHISPR